MGRMRMFQQEEIFGAVDIPWASAIDAMAGGTITAGDVVIVNNINTGRLQVIRADADAVLTGRGLLYLATGSVLVNEQVTCVPWGLSEGGRTNALNPTGGNINTAAAAVGDPVYLSDTAGGWSLAVGTFAVQIGEVLIVSATVGAIKFYPNASFGGGGAITGIAALTFTVNDDAVLGTNEDPMLRLLGGDGAEVIASRFMQDSSADLTSFSIVNAAGARRTPTFVIGFPGETTASLDARLRFDAATDGGVNSPFDVFYLGHEGLLEFGVTGSGRGVKLLDNTALHFGGATGATGDLIFNPNGTDVIVTGAGDLVFNDSVDLFFGTGKDIGVIWDSTRLTVTQAAANSAVWWGVSGAGIDHIFYGDTATRDVTWDQSADSLLFNDLALLVFGTGSDVTLRWDAVNLDLLAAVDDSQFFIGDGTQSFDVRIFGNIATAYTEWDASASTVSLVGPVRPVNFLNRLSSRFELKWVAGQHGRPGLNAAITPASADDGVDGATAAELDLMNATDRFFEILGVNSSNDDVTYNVEGGIAMETDGADGDEIILLPHLNAGLSPWTGVTWGTDRETHWECHLRTGANVTNCIIWCGLKLSNVEPVTTDADAVWFRYEDDDAAGAEWQARTSIANVDAIVGESAAVVTIDTDYYFRIEIQADRTARMFINGVLIGTSGALTATDLIPYIGVAADGAAAAKRINVYGQAISRLVGP